MKYTLLLLGQLLFSCMVYGQSKDSCHVYLIDVEASPKIYEKIGAILSLPPEEYVKLSKVLGTFEPEIGEEKLTTKHFPVPNSKAIVTASVYYTDESMALQKKGDKLINDTSITLGIFVSQNEKENAISAENNAVAESIYSKDTLGVRVKSNVIIDGWKYIVGLECRCNQSQPPQEK